MIGRERESKDLNRLYDSGRAELVAIYGRRRVGKTFLVDETFDGRITSVMPDFLRPMKKQKGLCRRS
jgi:AAA+ ATPase superfamily predicted ATPase